MRVPQERGETAVLAVGVVIRDMTTCLTVAAATAAAVVVTLLPIVLVLVAVAVDGVALRTFLQYFVPSIRANEFASHLQRRSGASPFVIASSAQVNGCPVLQSMKRLRLLRGHERND